MEELVFKEFGTIVAEFLRFDYKSSQQKRCDIEVLGKDGNRLCHQLVLAGFCDSKCLPEYGEKIVFSDFTIAEFDDFFRFLYLGKRPKSENKAAMAGIFSRLSVRPYFRELLEDRCNDIRSSEKFIRDFEITMAKNLELALRSGLVNDLNLNVKLSENETVIYQVNDSAIHALIPEAIDRFEKSSFAEVSADAVEVFMNLVTEGRSIIPRFLDLNQVKKVGERLDCHKDLKKFLSAAVSERRDMRNFHSIRGELFGEERELSEEIQQAENPNDEAPVRLPKLKLSEKIKKVKMEFNIPVLEEEEYENGGYYQDLDNDDDVVDPDFVAGGGSQSDYEDDPQEEDQKVLKDEPVQNVFNTADLGQQIRDGTFVLPKKKSKMVKCAPAIRTEMERHMEVYGSKNRPGVPSKRTKCVLCLGRGREIYLKSIREWEVHCRAKHIGLDKVKYIWPMQHSNAAVLSKHRKMASEWRKGHGEAPYSCTLCNNYNCDIGHSLKKHIMTSHNRTADEAAAFVEKCKGYVCKECGYRTATMVKNLKHRAERHGENIPFCETCSKPFEDEDILRLHRINCTEKARALHMCYKCFPQLKFSNKWDRDNHHKTVHKGQSVYDSKCDIHFQRYKVMEKHLQEAHLSDMLFFCDQCDYASMFSSYMNLHKRRAHADKMEIRECPICYDRKFGTEEGFRKHMLMHEQNKVHFCPMCNTKFGIVGDMAYKDHLRNAHNVVDIEADMPKEFQEKPRYEAAAEKWPKQEEAPYSCTFCPGRIATLTQKSIIDHYVRFHKDLSEQDIKNLLRECRGYPCKECGKKFENKDPYLRHIAEYHKADIPFCDLCRKPFQTKEEMQQHQIQTCLNRTKFAQTCIKCFPHQRFVSAEQKARHLRETHDGLSCYCSKCDIHFKRNAELDIHLRAFHLEEMTYHCDKCPFGAMVTGALRKHKRKEHGEGLDEMRKCNICYHRFFTSEAGYLEHMKDHAEGRVNFCPFCPFKRGIVGKKKYEDHLRKAHGENVESTKHEWDNR